MYLNHGGDIYTKLASTGKAPLDFSSNINPLGIPPAVVSTLKENAHTFAAYPDPLCRNLRAALSAYHGIGAEHIVCGNGAADLIHRLALACKPKEALVPAPTFSDYEKALREAGCGINHFFAKPPGFRIDKPVLSFITKNTDMFFLCNPNNPTGNLIPPDLLQAVVERCAETDTMLVIDECFNAFLDDPEANSALKYIDMNSLILKGGSLPPAPNSSGRSAPLRGSPLPPLRGGPPPATPPTWQAKAQIVILKAFTKTYALAGLRLGYILCSSPETAGLVAETGQSWPVSLAAECAGLAALGETAYLDEACRMIRTERERLKQELSGLGFEVLGGEANYIFFKTGEKHRFGGETFFRDLLERDILLRSCANYHGLDDSYFRIAVKKPEENTALIAAIESLVNR